MLRDVRADFIAAYLAEFKALAAAGRREGAEAVAAVLRDYYGHDVHGGETPVSVEAAVAAPLPETAAVSGPQPRRAARK
ncbi:hypothetical protein GCM10009765_58950 [Fodinicola feengrottensis]|uniref:Uncharacterized protein n=1 Tax=Fodinicola feengrottensis TaxID=435914 RepID=A0ABN2IBH4_9ACTN